MNEINAYISNWHSLHSGTKPQNEQLFINLFIDYLNISDSDEFVFDGNGAYFGKQFTIGLFEIAYSKDKISIYTSNHNGFWVAEYAVLTPQDDFFLEIKESVYNFIASCLGFTYCQ